MTDLAMRNDEGDSTTKMHSDRIAETVWRGRIGKSVMEGALRDVTALLSSKKVDIWLADTCAVASYSADIRSPATELLRAFKQHGTREVISIVPSDAVRMLGAALAIAVGFKLKMVPSRTEALSYIRSLESRP